MSKPFLRWVSKILLDLSIFLFSYSYASLRFTMAVVVVNTSENNLKQFWTEFFLVGILVFVFIRKPFTTVFNNRKAVGRECSNKHSTGWLGWNANRLWPLQLYFRIQLDISIIYGNKLVAIEKSFLAQKFLLNHKRKFNFSSFVITLILC